MKIFALLILLVSVSFAQTARDIRHYRGDDKTLIFRTTTDYSSDSVSFVIKASNALTSPRLVWKVSDTTSQMTLSNDTIIVYLDSIDTWDLASGKYVYDLEANGSTTIYYGNYYIDADVQSPFDGVDLPSDATRLTSIAIDNGTIQDEGIFWDTTLTRWMPAGGTFSNPQRDSIQGWISDSAQVLTQAQRDSIGVMISDSINALQAFGVFATISDLGFSAPTIIDYSHRGYVIDSVYVITKDSAIAFNLYNSNNPFASENPLFSEDRSVSTTTGTYYYPDTNTDIYIGRYFTIQLSGASGTIDEKLYLKIFYTLL